MNEISSMGWYAALVKPWWAPPSWLFGPVWTVLYIGIAVSFGRVLFLLTAGKIPFAVALPFFLNVLFNALFTPIQFGLRSNELAALDIVLVLATLIWAITAIYRYEAWISYAQIPYLLWVLFATVLQGTITVLNR